MSLARLSGRAKREELAVIINADRLLMAVDLPNKWDIERKMAEDSAQALQKQHTDMLEVHQAVKDRLKLTKRNLRAKEGELVQLLNQWKKEAVRYLFRMLCATFSLFSIGRC